MADFYLKSNSGVVERANSTVYAAGARVVPARADTAGNAAIAKRWVWEVTAGGGGSSGGSVPTWPASVTKDVTTVTDGALTLTARTPGFSSGTTVNWSFSTIYMDYAASAMAAGDTLYVSNAHSESVASAITINTQGTLVSPSRVLCVVEANPPTALSDTATVTTTGANGIVFEGTHLIHGVNFVAGNSNVSGINIHFSSLGTGGSQFYRECSFNLLNGNANSRIYVGSGSSQLERIVRWENCDIAFSEFRQFIQVAGATFQWLGGGTLVGTSTPTGNGLVGCYDGGRFGKADISGVNLSGFASGLVLCTNQAAIDATYRNVRLPSAWSTSTAITSTPSQLGSKLSLYNCDSVDTNYELSILRYEGTISEEVIVIRAGGANNGTTNLSYKLVSTANAEYPNITLDTPEIVRWNDTIGTPITVSVETLTDNVTLTNEQCWIEVQYLGTSGFPISSFISDAKADVLTTATNQDTSTATWVTTGITTPVRQRLSVTFTPQERGFLHAVVKLARPSTTVYVDPKITVS